MHTFTQERKAPLNLRLLGDVLKEGALSFYIFPKGSEGLLAAFY